MEPDKAGGAAAYENQTFRRRLQFACNGIRHALASEHNFRIQVGCLLLLLVALAILRPGALWWALALLAAAAVLAGELFNTALEHLIDHVHPDWHPQIRIVKDCAAAGVLVLCAGALAVAIALATQLIANYTSSLS